jgi:hypothetical protein
MKKRVIDFFIEVFYLAMVFLLLGFSFVTGMALAEIFCRYILKIV